MSEASRGPVSHAEQKEIGPNYFGYYVREIVELFSEKKDFLSPFPPQTSELAARTCAKVKIEDTVDHMCNGKEPSCFTGSGSLFGNGIGDGLLDFGGERLKASLKQSVVVLGREVDEILNPALVICQLQKHLEDKERLLNYSSAPDGDVNQSPCKKQNVCSSPSLTITPMPAGAFCGESWREESGSEDTNSEYIDAVLSEESQINELEKSCSDSQAMEILAQTGYQSGPKPLCNTGGIRYKKKRKACPSLNSGVKKEKKSELNEDLQLVLESDRSQTREVLKKYSDELYAKLGHMEQQLEELLDIVMSKCRSMTLTEKQQLRKLIQNLPPKNLDRVVEILQRSNQSLGDPCNEIRVDLEKEDNSTLWRLYYYVQAVINARKLSPLE